MSADLPRVGRLRRGYDVGQVDAFLASAAAALDGPSTRRPTAATIRRVGFRVIRGGYDPYAVDAALDDLERIAARGGTDAGPGAETESLLALLCGSDGSRFRRARWLSRGYSVPHVDTFCVAVAGTVRDGRGPTLREVRSVVFPPRRGGYVEDEVDALLDRVIDLLLLR